MNKQNCRKELTFSRVKSHLEKLKRGYYEMPLSMCILQIVKPEDDALEFVVIIHEYSFDLDREIVSTYVKGIDFLSSLIFKYQNESTNTKRV